MNIWQRHAERDRIWKVLDRGNNIALFGPRRLGKTYLMHLLEKDMNAKGGRSIFVDLSACSSPGAAITKIATEVKRTLGAKGLWLQAKTRISDLLGGEPEDSDWQSALLKADWKLLLSALLETLNDDKTETIILIDELSVCLVACLARDEESGRELLYELKSNCKTYDKVHWFFTGSIGLDQIAEQHELSGALNDLYPFKLDPLDSEQATALTNHLCVDRGYPEPKKEAHEYLQKRIGWLSPHYITRFVDHADEIISSGGKLNISIVDEVCEMILEFPYNRLFSDWPDHINKNYPPELEACARDILSLLSKHENGEQKNTLYVHKDLQSYKKNQIDRTLETLCSDGYLLQDDNRHRFMFGLLREYWDKKFN